MKASEILPIQALASATDAAPITVAVNRGGARNRRDRTSHVLTATQCRRLIEAADRALMQERPFNRFITVSWERSGADGRDSVCLTGAFVRLAREWMAARDQPLVWAWVQEWSPRFGTHAHILLHVPDELEPLFRAYPRRWVTKLIPGPYLAGTIKTKLLRRDTRPTAYAPTYEHALLRTVSYMLKAALAALEGPLGMIPYRSKPWGQHCMTYGKRMGIWQGWQDIVPGAQ